MFTIKSISARPVTDDDGHTTVEITISAGYIPMKKEEVIPASVFKDEESALRAVGLINNKIAPAVNGTIVFYYPNLPAITEKIKAMDSTFFTGTEAGVKIIKTIAALLKNIHDISFLLSGAVAGD